MVWPLGSGLSTVFAWSMNNIRLTKYPNNVIYPWSDHHLLLLLAGGKNRVLEKIESKTGLQINLVIYSIRAQEGPFNGGFRVGCLIHP